MVHVFLYAVYLLDGFRVVVVMAHSAWLHHTYYVSMNTSMLYTPSLHRRYLHLI